MRHYYILKFLLTIFCTLCLLQTFGQSDSLLQRLIEDAKIQQQVNKPAAPVVKDTARKIVKPPALKKDSSIVSTPKTINPDTTLTATQPRVVTDTITVPPAIDSASIITEYVSIKQPLGWLQDTAFANLLNLAPGSKKTISLIKDGDLHLPLQKDFLFYLLVGVILLLAIIRQLFPKYFQNLFRIFFQASFRQKQTREQLMQETLPSLMMNILFILVCGLFIALLAGNYSSNYKWLHTSFWMLAMYSTTILALVYMFKYLVIRFTGWAFQVKEQASTYGFIVFLVNKVIGLAMLPLLLLLAFSSGPVQEITVTVAACLVVLLLLFRYIVSLTIIRGTVSIHPIHFFIYLCAVEIVPMLIIYKVLFNYTGKSNL